jgi:hypothetical protein
MIRVPSLAAASAAALAMGALAGCSSSGAPPAASASASDGMPAASSAPTVGGVPVQATPDSFVGSPADQAAYHQAFSPLADCEVHKHFSRVHRSIKSETVSVNAGNDGYCTYSIYIAGRDIPSETVTSQAQHGIVKFLTLDGQVVTGYRANPGYSGPDQFAISFVRADGLSYPIVTQVTVATPATK